MGVSTEGVSVPVLSWWGTGTGPKARPLRRLSSSSSSVSYWLPLVCFPAVFVWVRRRVNEGRASRQPPARSEDDKGETGVSHRPGFPRNLTQQSRDRTQPQSWELLPMREAPQTEKETHWKATHVQFRNISIVRRTKDNRTRAIIPPHGPHPGDCLPEDIAQLALWKTKPGLRCFL